MNLIKSRLKSILKGFQKAYETPSLPPSIISLNNQLYIIILRFLGWISVLTFLSKNYLNYPVFILYVSVFFSTIFFCYHNYLTYHRLKHTIFLVTSDKLEVRNSPLDIFAFLAAKTLTCLKTGWESAPHIVVGLCIILCVAEILKLADAEPFFGPLLGGALKAVLPEKQLWIEMNRFMELIIEYKNNLFSLLNTICVSIGLTEFSFLFCLKLIFFIIFIFLNICLLYTEYLDRKHTNININNPESCLKSGMSPELQKIAKKFVIGIGVIAALITIKNEVTDQNKKEILRSALEKAITEAKEEAKKAATQELRIKFAQKMQLTNINNSMHQVRAYEEEESALRKALKEKKVEWTNDPDEIKLAQIESYERKLELLELRIKRAWIETMKSCDEATKFSDVFTKVTDEDQALAMITEGEYESGVDIKNSSFIDLEAIWARYETFDGLTKAACVMMLSSYFIISCALGVGINLYGDYLLDRFKLEEKYPKVAIFIKYRKKASKFYIFSNLIYILLVCLMNMYFGISIIALIYT